MEKICRLLSLLGNSLDREETLASFDRELRSCFAYEAISLHLIEGNELVPAYAAGEEFRRLASTLAVSGEGFLESAAAGTGPVVKYPLEGMGKLGTAVAIPLAGSCGAMGVLAVYRTGGRAFCDREVELLESVVPKLAAAVENAERYRAAVRLAGIDSATGVLNGRGLFQRLDAELARSRRAAGPVAVLQCNIEGLDESSPDRLLSMRRRLATTLLAGCREYDAVAWNGNAFILVLAGLGVAGLAEKCARIRQSVQETGGSAGWPLSARIGAAFYPQDAMDAEGLLVTASQRAQGASLAADFENGVFIN